MGLFISKEDFAKLRPVFKAENKTVGLCHGVYDLLHPGHVIHFEEAKKQCDILVVSVTSEEFVRKGPGRPYFNNDLRIKFLCSLAIVDYVMLSESYTADDVIKAAQPDYYIKGGEYSSPEDDITGEIDAETALVQSFGGQAYFTSGAVFSSTRLLNKNFPVLTPELKEWMAGFCEKYSFGEIKNVVEAFHPLKVLVVGDIIIDDYMFCTVNGLMSKDRGYSTTYNYQERYLGGALAVARHLAQFSGNVTICGAIGNETDLHSLILNSLSKDMKIDLEYLDGMNTIVKQRYILENKKRETIDKLFSVNRLPERSAYRDLTEAKLMKKLNGGLERFDLVVAADFGHGLLTPGLMDFLQKNSGFMALNCQTNSTNYGFNLITKYLRADVFSLDQKELRLALADNAQDDEALLLKLWERFGKKTAFLTRGAYGAMAAASASVINCPAFTLTVKDTVGAGDAFFALAALCAKQDLPPDLSVFLSNVAAALATNIIGNKEAIAKVDFLKYAKTLMNL
ncbi:MAG: PfkB family carbohydrate kinase [Syntrophomonadaceae bacterium]|jgi:rfaE bifunctional protein nucleotidyltransferase chain/domain|nr:PfkB family carbohydrate kinase [Syntrophomonadaceae bacterium]